LSGRYLLGVITNGAADVQREKVAATGLDSYFPVIVPSGEAGAWKPSPLIFERALSLAGVRPEEAIHVGDNLVNDVAGAQGAGLRGVWLNRRGAVRPAAGPAPDIEIGDLHALLSHLPPPAGPA
jgi:putative hydrolase of the HAD superfamily